MQSFRYSTVLKPEADLTSFRSRSGDTCHRLQESDSLRPAFYYIIKISPPATNDLLAFIVTTTDTDPFWPSGVDLFSLQIFSNTLNLSVLTKPTIIC